MSVLLQLKIFGAIASLSGIGLLIKPSLLLRSPLEPTLVRLTGLRSSTIDPADSATTGIVISAIGLIYWCTIWTGDEKFVKASAIMSYLLLFTDRGSTGLLIMLTVDSTFALWLGFTIGFKNLLKRGPLVMDKKKE